MVNKLKEYRIKNNLKQKDIAEILGITTSYYGMIEIGKRKVSLDIALRLSSYYKVPVEEIFKLDDNKDI